MRKRRVLSILMMFCLLVSIMCVPASAAEEDSTGLEQAITAVKNIITVPESYSEFTNHPTQVEVNGKKVTSWRLNWSEKDGGNGSISAAVDENGILYEYNKYTGNEDQKGLAKITREQAQKSAEEFLGKAIKTDVGEMKITDKDSNIVQSGTYNFSYKKFLNNAPVNFCTANIDVDKYTGEVIFFRQSNIENNKLEYPALEGTIDTVAAEKDYIEKLGVDLKYYSYYDYDKEKINVYAGYSVDDSRYKAIDGKTGEITPIFHEDKIYDTSFDEEKAAGSTGDKIFTKEETDAINNVAGLITKEKAESIIRGTSDIITSDIKVKGVSLYKDDINKKYVWEISFEGGYGNVDAKSGELLSLYFYDESSNGNKNISKPQAKNIAEDFLKKVSLNKFQQTKYIEESNPITKKSTTVLKGNENQEDKISSFKFVRQVNGIEFASNSLSIEVNNTTGKIIEYSSDWYDNVEFPDISQAMNKETAFNKLKELKGFELQYTMVDQDKVKLVYNFGGLDGRYVIDPISGIRLDYTGQAYKENKLPQYTDINGHWCEKTVKELLENGYYIKGDKFNPDMNITQSNFLKYIYSSTQSSYNEDEFYDMLIQNGIIKKEEKNPKSFVSNQDAAKFIIRYLGYSKVAEHPEIFANPFKDTIEEQGKGYAAMCYGLGIMKGDKNGNFNGSHNISNAEAAIIVYNLVSLNNKQ